MHGSHTLLATKTSPKLWWLKPKIESSLHAFEPKCGTDICAKSAETSARECMMHDYACMHACSHTRMHAYMHSVTTQVSHLTPGLT